MRVARRRLSSRPPSDNAEHPQGSGSRTKFRTKRVLIVDDNDDNRELFATVLRDAGIVIENAGDGAGALEIAARDRPDVILMDLAMPVMDGFEAIERLRNDEHGRSAYIIVISAFCDRTSRDRAEAVGADAFLAKPCSPKTLIAAVEAAFATCEAMDSPRRAAG